MDTPSASEDAPRRSHVMVVHRWRDGHALYGDYIDHDFHNVSYITTALGRSSVPDRAANVLVVPRTDDQISVRKAVADLVGQFGPPDHLVALNEGDLDLAAVLRAELRCSGQRSAELARFRDKLEMVSRVAAGGVRVPTSA